MDPIKELTETYQNTGGFGYTVKYKVFEYSAEFRAFKITALVGEHMDVPEYDQSPDYTSPGALETAVPCITGSVGWDGCINYDFPNGYEHACGLEDMKKLFEFMETIYNRCAELIPTFDW